MRNLVAWSIIIVCACAPSTLAQNKVVFDNQSGEPTLVKLIGPTQTEVQVPNAAKVGVDATAGRYIIKVRYGTPGKYRYSKGEEFEIKETAATTSETTITLHKVVAGNYDAQPISAEEFGTEQSPANAQTPKTKPVEEQTPPMAGGERGPTKTSSQTETKAKGGRTGSITAGPWEVKITSFEIRKEFAQKVPSASSPTGRGEIRPKLFGGEVVALVGVSFRRLRAYSKEEEADTEKLSYFDGMIKVARKWFGGEMYLANSSFTLLYLYDDNGKRKVMLSECLSLGDDTNQILCVYDRSASMIVGTPKSDQILIKLAFVYDPADRNPILFFSPIPNGSESRAARITVQEDGGFRVEYGDAKEMRKYFPPEVRKD